MSEKAEELIEKDYLTEKAIDRLSENELGVVHQIMLGRGGENGQKS